MSQTSLQDTLFSEAELTSIQPTGSPWIISDDDPATVPVPTETTIVSVEGPYTERDRKLWVFLLHAVFDELGEKPMHTLSVREINAVFRELAGQHDSKWIWESAKRLAKTLAEWKTVGGLGDERFEEMGMGTLLFASLHKKHRSSGNLHFGFPPNLVAIIKEPMRFARLRVHFLLKLSGKYAVTLYEVLEGFVNRRDGRCEVSIKDLRQWLSVPTGSYKTWKDFRKWVLDPAIKQINDDPIGAGFSVRYTAVRKGRSYDKLVFELTKTDNRKTTEKLMKRKALAKRKAKEGDKLGIPAWAEERGRQIAVEKGWDYGTLEREFKAWANDPKDVGAAFIGFCKKKEALR
jgi:hypothetical protein